MDNEAKLLLYNQLIKIEEIANVNKKKLIKFEDYEELTDRVYF